MIYASIDETEQHLINIINVLTFTLQNELPSYLDLKYEIEKNREYLNLIAQYKIYTRSIEKPKEE